MGKITLDDKSFETYIREEQILEAVKEVAVKINSDYEGKHPLIISVLNGSFMFTADLLKELDIVCEVSFIKLASYSGTASTGVVRELIGIDNSIENQHVIILEDIVDTGNTLEKIMEMVGGKNPASIAIATLLYKPQAYKKNRSIDYVGMEIPNEFIVGYGLDYNGLGRNLRNIYKIVS